MVRPRLIFIWKATKSVRPRLIFGWKGILLFYTGVKSCKRGVFSVRFNKWGGRCKQESPDYSVSSHFEASIFQMMEQGFTL